jgi:transposase-like protein
MKNLAEEPCGPHLRNILTFKEINLDNSDSYAYAVQDFVKQIPRHFNQYKHISKDKNADFRRTIRVTGNSLIEAGV